jgi:Fis family transcriptional regulator, factor for inversion stimulation protein
VKEQLERIVLEMYRNGIPYADAVREFERTFIVSVLRQHKGNQIKAAKELGIHRNTLRRQIRMLAVDIKTLRGVRKRPPAGERLLVRRKESVT